MSSSCPPPKLFNTALVSWNTTSAAIRCCLPELIPKPRKIIHIGGRCLWILSLHLLSIPGQFFVFPVTYFPKNLNNPHLFYSYGRVPLRTRSVTANHLHASTDFAYWVIFLTLSSTMGRFFHFRFPKKRQPAFIKNKEKKTTHSTFQPITVFRGAL